jgi:hypothetical protein
MTKRTRVVRKVVLEYRLGKEEPQRGIFRNAPVDPRYTGELLIAIRSDEDPLGKPWCTDDRDARPQVHLVGSARALEELGRYLIALARLKTADPEPYGSFDRVGNADGGTVRLLPRRLKSVRASRGRFRTGASTTRRAGDSAVRQGYRNAQPDHGNTVERSRQSMTCRLAARLASPGPQSSGV